MRACARSLRIARDVPQSPLTLAPPHATFSPRADTHARDHNQLAGHFMNKRWARAAHTT